MTTVIVDRPEEGVTRVTLHRPDRLNAMNAELIGELHDALADIAVDPTRPTRAAGSRRRALRRLARRVVEQVEH